MAPGNSRDEGFGPEAQPAQPADKGSAAVWAKTPASMRFKTRLGHWWSLTGLAFPAHRGLRGFHFARRMQLR
jgi:hypothetical protein